MAFVNMHIYFFLFLHFDTSLLLLTVTLRGVSNKHCLLSLFSFHIDLTLPVATVTENGRQNRLKYKKNVILSQNLEV